MAKAFTNSELLVRVAERLRPTCSFTAHDCRDGEVVAVVGPVRAWAKDTEAATLLLATRVADRLASQIDHDLALLLQLDAELTACGVKRGE